VPVAKVVGGGADLTGEMERVGAETGDAGRLQCRHRPVQQRHVEDRHHRLGHARGDRSEAAADTRGEDDRRYVHREPTARGEPGKRRGEQVRDARHQAMLTGDAPIDIRQHREVWTFDSQNDDGWPILASMRRLPHPARAGRPAGRGRAAQAVGAR
jgi:hypothetical protein